MARGELLRFSWQAQDCVLVACVVTPGVGVGESVLGAVSGCCGVFWCATFTCFEGVGDG